MVYKHLSESQSLSRLVQLNLPACDGIASLLKRSEIPLDQEESSLAGIPRELIGNFYLALVAICHQTSPAGKPPLEGDVRGVHRRGWDYLSGKLEVASEGDTSWLAPERWSSLSVHEVQSLFLDPQFGNRLTNPLLRTELLRDLGTKMVFHGWNSTDQIYRLCEGRIASETPNLLDTLSLFRAFRDPVRKKSLFYLALMRNTHLWNFADNEHLGPPVDYHEVRGHLRLGTVVIENRELLEKVKMGRLVEEFEDVAIRKAVYDAMMYISQRSGLRNPSHCTISSGISFARFAQESIRNAFLSHPTIRHHFAINIY